MQICLWLFVAMAVCGLIVCVVLLLFSTWARKHINRFGEILPKIAIEMIQVIPIIIAVFVANSPAINKDDWCNSAISGAVSIFVWKCVQIILDLRQKGEVSRAKATSEMLTRLLFGIRDGVGKKLKRVQELTRREIRQTTIGHVREALTPKPHLIDLLDQLAMVLRGQLQVGGTIANIRVGVYINQAGHLEPVHGICLKNPGYNPFTSHKEHRHSFELKLTNKSCHVVRCVIEKRTLLVPDCRTASLSTGFFFSHDDQKQYLRSMVAYHLGEVFDEKGIQTDSAIALDSDQPDFFKESDRSTIESVLQEFGLRIRLELALQAFLGKRETNS